MPGLDGGGIGAIAVHPSRSFLAVAEKCKHRSPNVYVYKYPDLSLHRVSWGRKGRVGELGEWPRGMVRGGPQGGVQAGLPPSGEVAGRGGRMSSWGQPPATQSLWLYASPSLIA